MRIHHLLLGSATALLLLSGCEAITGKELARLTIDTLSTPDHLVMRAASLDLKKGDQLVFWSHLDLAYDGNAELRMRVRVTQHDSDLALLEMDPFEKNMTLNEVKTEVSGHTEWRFTGKNQAYAVPADGNYTFKAILTAEPNPSLRINKAELLLKK